MLAVEASQSTLTTRMTPPASPSPKLVTIGLPLYRRLDFLPAALASVAAQDYPHIELLISDNGQNPDTVRDLIDQHYSKPYTFRRNASTIPATFHYNQIIEEASGEYFMLLCDDDEISPNYVSALVTLLDEHPDTAVAFGRQEIIDGDGRVLRHSNDDVPAVMHGTDFLMAWCRYELRFECWVTNLARRSDIRRRGGFLHTPWATHSDDGLLVKMALNGDVRFAQRATFRWRVDGSSHGWNIHLEHLAADTRHFLTFLDEDPIVRERSRRHPAWGEAKRELVKMAWETYWYRWSTMYRERVPFRDWARGAFALPPIAPYYRRALRTLFTHLRRAGAARYRGLFNRAPDNHPAG